jgi:hypothetical protein
VTELSPAAWRLRRCLVSLDRELIFLAEVWACLLGMSPDLVTAPDRRHRLRQAIDELVAESWLALPSDPNAYDRARDPPLPRAVRIVAPTQRATRVGVGRGTSWRPEMSWAAALTLSDQDHEDLLRINEWLSVERPRVIVPPRERSLQLFGSGHEDRLHEMSRSKLFGPDRLTWDLLACAPVPPPLVWSPVGPGATMLVVSGHETFASIRRTLVEAPATPVGLVVHGAGGYFASAIPFLRTLDRTVERILYFGDLDAADLATPASATGHALAEGLPPVEPAMPLYELLLRHGRPSVTVPSPVTEARELAAWLAEPLRADVRNLLVGGLRIAQEWVGYETLLAEEVWKLLL